MSLTLKRKLSEKNLAANRSNGRKSRGPVTLEGKKRSARSNLRHGFYSQDDEMVMLALGEDPEEYKRMMAALQTDLAQAMEQQVVGRIGRAFWRMRRAERVQDGLAVKRIRTGTEIEELRVGPPMVQNYEFYENLCALSRRINAPPPTPSRDEIEALIGALGDNPPDAVRALFPLYRAYWEAVGKASSLADGETEPSPAAEAAQLEITAAFEKFDAVMFPLSLQYRQTLDMGLEKLNRVKSPENIAALMAPKGENAVLMQRMEDSNLRQLWRLTSILMKIRKGHLDDAERTNSVRTIPMSY